MKRYSARDMQVLNYASEVKWDRYSVTTFLIFVGFSDNNAKNFKEKRTSLINALF